MPPLSGLRVVDCSRLLPGPFATRMLADLGADVIKVEDPNSGDYLRFMPPHVDGMNVGFGYLHRGKRSLTLNLRDPRGIEAARRVVAKADVLLESYRPGVMRSMGLGYEILAQENPRLVYCALTGYGQEGPLAQRAGHDITYLARSGAASVTGTRAGEPVVPGMQAADLAGGSQMAVIAILAAIAQRERTGQGQFLDVSMTDGAMALLGLHAAEALYRGEQPARGEGLLWGSVPGYRYYRCADGGWLAVGALEPKFWQRLCEALDVPDLAGDGLARGARRAEVEARLEARFAERSRDAWREVLDGVDCCVEPVLDIVEAFAARGLSVPTSPLRGSGWQAPELEKAPQLGAHTREILLEAGYDDAEVDELAKAGVAVT